MNTNQSQLAQNLDSSLVNLNQSFLNSNGTQVVNSPQNANMMVLYNQINQSNKNMIVTDSTHANSFSDANGSQSLAQKRMRS